MKAMLFFSFSLSLFPWESNRADRFEEIRYRIPGLFNYPVKYDVDGMFLGMAHRKKLGFSQTLGHIGSSNNSMYIQKAVSMKDGNCFFSKDSSQSAHMSHVKTKWELKCVDFKNWLDHNVPHSALAVAKMDIEKTEFELIPYLLQYPDTFRRIDELYLECHHTETWGHRPHSYSECLKLFEDIRKIGIVVHEWF